VSAVTGSMPETRNSSTPAGDSGVGAAAGAPAGAEAAASGAGADGPGVQVTGAQGPGAQVTGTQGPGAAGTGAQGTGHPDHGVAAGVSEAAAPQDAGTGSAVRVTATTAPPPPPSHEDSLNLVRLVGPAIAKRAVPVILAAVGMALLGRLLWHLRRREEKA